MAGRLTAARKSTTARAILAPHRFRRGRLCGPAQVSPRLSVGRRKALARWLEALPEEFTARLPRIKIAAAAALQTPARRPAHAASFIPQRYLLLADSLFSRPGELGRIVYHEICHFVWPRLGKARRIFEAAVAHETEAGIAGELGHSSSLAKEELGACGRRKRARDRRWRHYLCESFCDTGAYVLVRRAGHRRSRHSEWTLGLRARSARVRAWTAAVGLS